jgi:hypothetical protein
MAVALMARARDLLKETRGKKKEELSPLGSLSFSKQRSWKMRLMLPRSLLLSSFPYFF